MNRVLALARVLLAAAIAWSAVVALAAAAVLYLSGADPYATVGMDRPAMAAVISMPFDPMDGLAQVAPLAAPDALWSAPLGGVPGWVATGTYVQWEGRRFLVTASHAVQGAPLLAWLGLARPAAPLVQRDAAGRDWPLGWGRMSHRWDLVVYPAPDDGVPALEVRRDALHPGEPVRFVGFPFQEAQPWAADSVVTALHPHPSRPGPAAVRASIAPTWGQSGGALLDAQGRLVGIGVALTPVGLVATGSGALAAVLAGEDRTVSLEPAPAISRLGAGSGGALLLAAALTVGLDRTLRRLAALARMWKVVARRTPGSDETPIGR